MVAPGFSQVVQASIRQVELTRANTTTRHFPDVLFEGLSKPEINPPRLKSEPIALTHAAITLARNFRHITCNLVVDADGTEIVTPGIGYDQVLLNLHLLGKVYEKTGYCTALPSKLDDTPLLMPERYKEDDRLFATEAERTQFNHALRIVNGPASTLPHDIIIDYSYLDEEKLAVMKKELTKSVLLISKVSGENYRFVRRIPFENIVYWATEMNLLEWSPMDLLKKATALIEREVQTARPIAIAEQHGRIYYITEEVKDSITLAEAMRSQIPDKTKNMLLFEVGLFIRDAEKKGISITDPNMTNFLVNKTNGQITLIDIAEIVVHKEGEQGYTMLTGLLSHLSYGEKLCVNQGHNPIRH